MQIQNSLISGLFFIVGAVGLTSCGKNQNSSLKSGEGTRPLLVVMGGFSTCALVDQHKDWESPLGMRMYKHAKELVAAFKIERGTEFDLILSCFNKLGELRYTESKDQFEKLYINQAPEEVAARIEQEISLHPKSFIVGHSYGGWLAMKSVAKIDSTSDHLKSIYSIDPISRKNCRLENPVNWGYCTEAPSDVTADNMQSIQESSAVWSNYWQNQTFYLHSAKIEFADLNTKMPTSHTEIDDIAEIWSYQMMDIRKGLDSTLKGNPALGAADQP